MPQMVTMDTSCKNLIIIIITVCHYLSLLTIATVPGVKGVPIYAVVASDQEEMFSIDNNVIYINVCRDGVCKLHIYHRNACTVN